MIELLNKNAVKVLTLYSLSPGSGFNRETIKEKTGINNVSVNKSLNSLVNSKIIKQKDKLYFLNFEEEYCKNIIKAIKDNYIKLKSLPLRAYFNVLEIYYSLAENKINGEVYLFGSYSKLTFRENSDIDIAVISEEINKKNMNKIISKIEDKIGKNVEVHYFSKEFHKNKRDPLVKEIIQNGVRLI